MEKRLEAKMKKNEDLLRQFNCEDEINPIDDIEQKLQSCDTLPKGYNNTRIKDELVFYLLNIKNKLVYVSCSVTVAINLEVTVQIDG